MLKQKYFLTGIFILSAERQPIKLAWRKIVWLLLFSCFILIFCLVDSYNVKYVWFENMQTVIPSVFTVQPVLVLYISDSAQWFLSIFHVLRSFVLIAGSCFTFHFILLFGSTLWNKCQSNVILLKVLNESPLRHFLFVSLHQIRE